jgi:hypothetical protein
MPESPFHYLTILSRSELAATRDIPSADRYLLAEHFVAAFQWESIRILGTEGFDRVAGLWYTHLKAW